MLGLPLYTQYCADHYINTKIFAASYGLLVGQLDYLQAAEDGQYDKLGWASSSICQ